MSKFVIECPSCGRYAEANGGLLGFFSTKKINCQCGYIINVKTDRMTSRECSHCKNLVIFDQGKGESAKCPVCHESINTQADIVNTVEFHCPSCSCKLSAYKGLDRYTCPLCNTDIDVKNQVDKEKLLADGNTQVIKYEGDADSLIWKHPITDFNSGSQLIVAESQEALFFRDGRALDLFSAGRHTLNTAQMPIAKQNEVLIEDEGQSFTAQVYYVNLSQQMAIKWGTSDKITLIDPTSKAPIAIGARGLFNCRVSDSRKIVLKLAGTTSGISRQNMFGGEEGTSNSNIKNYFRSVIKLCVSTKLAEAITENNIDILQIDKDKLKLSQIMQEYLLSYFEDYGIEITEFLIEGIILPDRGELGYDVVQTLIKLRQSDLEKSVIANETDMKLTRMEADKTVNERSQQIDAELEKSRREAMAAKQETELLKAQLAGQTELAKTKAEVEAERLRMQLEMERKLQTAQIEGEEMRLKGYTQQDVLQAQVLTSYAENQPLFCGGGITGIAGTAMQLGAGLAAANAAANMGAGILERSSSVLGNNTASKGWDCTCGKKGITGNFCDNCGNKKPEPKTGAWDCSCGQKGITGNFCSNCGNKKPIPIQVTTWNCSCGNTGITGNFCSNCGNRKPQDEPATWNCSCGKTDISGNFCDNCGKKKGE